MEEWGRLRHLYVTVFLSSFPSYMVIPVITDVTVEAVCQGKDECSLAIYLSGFQQAISGLGSVVMMPLIGNLSDAHSRKNLLTIPMTLAIIPLVILACNQSTNFVYAYYAFKTLTAMIAEGGVLCLSLGYLADSVPEAKRVAVFGVLSGVGCAANVFGTLAARLLSISQIFQVAALASIVATVYMRIFLKDTNAHDNDSTLEQPFMPLGAENRVRHRASPMNIAPTLKDVFCLFNSSITFAIAASVTFFASLADAGGVTFSMYFFKARYHFNKDQFAQVFLIINIGAALTNVIFMPIFGSIVGEEALLPFSLFNGFLNMLLCSIAWSPKVPYGSAFLGMFFTLWSSCVRSIVSKKVGPNEQGIAQGCILGITSFANVVSPLIFSPLSALFLSDGAPFHFPGFCMLCIGLAYLIGFVLSVMIKVIPLFSRKREQKCVEGLN